METVFHKNWFNEPDEYVDSIYFVCYAGKSTAPGYDFGCADTYKEAVEMCRQAVEETGSPAHVCVCRDESVDEENAYELGYEEGREFLKAHGVDEYEVVFETEPGLNDIMESYKQCKSRLDEFTSRLGYPDCYNDFKLYNEKAKAYNEGEIEEMSKNPVFIYDGDLIKHYCTACKCKVTGEGYVIRFGGCHDYDSLGHYYFHRKCYDENPKVVQVEERPSEED